LSVDLVCNWMCDWSDVKGDVMYEQ
jgi:hypothetical protein